MIRAWSEISLVLKVHPKSIIGMANGIIIVGMIPCKVLISAGIGMFAMMSPMTYRIITGPILSRIGYFRHNHSTPAGTVQNIAVSHTKLRIVTIDIS